MQIDILMAVRNGEKFISQQIDSILKQDYPHFQLIIRDNSSEDQTCQIVKKYIEDHPGKIRLIASSENVGAMGNFSRLMEASASEYIMFSDHDDIWLPNKISQAMERMRTLEKEAGKGCPLLVHTDLRVVNRDLDLLYPSFWQISHINPIIGKNKLHLQLLRNTITGNTLLINRALLEMASPIPEEAIMHDWWIGLVAAAFGMIGCLKQQTILYRQHEHNVVGVQPHSSTRDDVKKRQEIMLRLEKQAAIFLERYLKELSKKDRRLVIHFLHFLKGNFLIKAYLVMRCRFYKYSLASDVRDFFLCKTAKFIRLLSSRFT